MTYVITQPCIGVKDTSCVDVCPVDCIQPASSEEDFDTAEQLYINPDELLTAEHANLPAPSPPFSKNQPCQRNGGIFSRSTRIITKANCSFQPRA